MVNRLIDLSTELGHGAFNAGRRVIGHPVVKGVATTGAGAVMSGVDIARGATDSIKRVQARRDAISLASKIRGAGYSEDTLVNGTPHFVVWKNGVPIEAFPRDIDGVLAARPELQDFQETKVIFPA